MTDVSDLRDTPFNLGDRTYGSSWDGAYRSVDGTPTGHFSEEDVAEVLYHGGYGFDDYDGFEAAVLKLRDDRLVAYETWWGPTGSGFSADAYGADADVWFASEGHLKELVLQALGDEGRRACGLAVDGGSL